MRVVLCVVLAVGLICSALMAGCGGGGGGGDGGDGEGDGGDGTTPRTPTPPDVVDVTPGNRTLGVSVFASVSATFSDVMDAATFSDATFVVEVDSTAVAGGVSFDPGTRTATFVATRPLAAQTLHWARLTTGIEDAEGDALAAEYSWKFVTEHLRVPATGQATCYDESGTEIAASGTGQDGEIQAGLAPPTSRFVDHGDGTVTDTFTGLMWLENVNCIQAHYPEYDADAGPGDGMVHWDLAFAFVQGMNDGTYGDCAGGHSDWRLPTINDLISLRDLSQSTPALQAGHPFEGSWGQWRVWSSTATSSNGLYNLSLYSGTISASAKSFWTAYVWPVRGKGAGPALVASTGQTTCHDVAGDEIPCAGTGQDGETQSGVPWPDPRFSDNGDGTLTDRLTGLTWLLECNPIATWHPTFDQDGTAGDGAVTWQHALDFVLRVNAGSFALGSLTHTDWRIANPNEIDSFLPKDRSNVPTWLAARGFDNVLLDWRWSSTSSAQDPSRAHIWQHITGTWAWNPKTDHFYLQLVRGGDTP